MFKFVREFSNVLIFPSAKPRRKGGTLFLKAPQLGGGPGQTVSMVIIVPFCPEDHQ